MEKVLLRIEKTNSETCSIYLFNQPYSWQSVIDMKASLCQVIKIGQMEVYVVGEGVKTLTWVESEYLIAPLSG